MHPDIRLIVFDINGTLIRDNSWQKLNLAFGLTSDEDQALWQANQQGRLPNDRWVQAVSRLYHERGQATRERFEQVLLTYTYLPGAREVLRTLQQRGYDLALLSGSPDFLVAHLSHELHVPRWAGNATLSFDDAGHFTALTVPDEEPQAKLNHLRRWQAELGLRNEQIACVGDGGNEAPLFAHTGRGVTLAGSLMTDSAWRVVPDLRDLSEVFP